MSTEESTQESTDRKLSESNFGMMAGVSVLAVFALVVAIVALGVAATSDESGSASGGGTTTVDVVLTEFAVTPDVIEVPAGDTLVLNVTNEGEMVHDLKLGDGVSTEMLDPGDSETIDVGVIDSDSEVWCTVPGHKEAGMVAAVKVIGGDGSESSDTASSHDATDGGEFATVDPDAEPDADWTPYDPTLAPAPGGTEHEITLRATETELEVAPGVTQMMWTFEDQVPGPILRGKVGDLFTVTLVNEGVIGHSIDFHASKVAWDDEMRTIASGEELVYQFRADHAGAFMYHCGTSPTLHHIGNGMYGAIIIDPPDLAPVAKEYAMVQSELYLGPQGKEGDLTKMQNEDFDAVVFNGYWNQYAFDPIDVEANERIRVWVVDDGPSENSAFHIVGTVFDTVWKEGTYLLQPDERRGGAQVLDLQPAQGGFVEFTFAEEGFYPMVTHKFSNAGKGALGLFRAGDVEMRTSDSH